MSFLLRRKKQKKRNGALAGSRTRVGCLEGNHANRYTTNACFHWYWINNLFQETAAAILSCFLTINYRLVAFEYAAYNERKKHGAYKSGVFIHMMK